MKSEDLLKYIGGVDDKFVDELAEEKIVSIAELRRRRSRWLTLAACFAAVVLCASILMGADMNADKGKLTLSGGVTDVQMAHNTLVMLDVNPSIQLEVNDRSVVVKAEALNGDAEGVIAGLQLEGKTYEDAVKLTLAVLQDGEYITNLKNSLLVTVVDSDETKAEEIRSRILETIQLLDDNTSYDLSILSQIFTDVSEFADIAERHDMSAGRAALIDEICKAQENYDFEELAGCNIQTINQLLEYIGVPEFVQRIGTAAATVPDELKDKLNLDGLSQDELISFTLAVSDFYNKLCEYYDEADVANHIGYVFNIVCKESDDGSKSWALLAENLSNELYSKGAIINIGECAITDWYGSVKDIVDFFDDLA